MLGEKLIVFPPPHSLHVVEMSPIDFMEADKTKILPADLLTYYNLSWHYLTECSDPPLEYDIP